MQNTERYTFCKGGEVRDSANNIVENSALSTLKHINIAADAENAFYRTEVDILGRKVRTPVPFSEAPVMEKNLFYVAVTRAKRNLDLGLCERLFVQEEETADDVVSEPATEAA